MIDLLSVASGSTYQHSSQRTPPPPTHPHPAASLFISSSQVRSHSFLTTVARLSLVFSFNTVVWTNRTTLNHIVAVNDTFLSFSDSEQWKSAHREGKKRPPWRPNAHRPALGCREPPRSWSPPDTHTTYADFHHIHHHAGPRTTAALTQACRSQRQPQFLFWPLEWELVSGTTRNASLSKCSLFVCLFFFLFLYIRFQTMCDNSCKESVFKDVSITLSKLNSCIFYRLSHFLYQWREMEQKWGDFRVFVFRHLLVWLDQCACRDKVLL